jgi:serine/threonine-protein kinase
MGKHVSRLVILGVLCAAVAAGAGSAFAGVTYPIPTCVVPKVTGTALAQAEKSITKAKCAIGPITTANSATVPAGDVISTNPAGGTTKPAGTPVSIVVSSGKTPPPTTKPCVVPKVVNDTTSKAITALNNAHCQVGTITNASSKTVPAGKVISSNPAAGTTHASLFKVNLTVSSGKGKSPTAPCVVPALKGKTSKQAATLLVAANCAVGTITLSASTTVPKDDVISSSPAAGTSHPSGTPVSFVLSSGKGTPAHASCVVPALKGKTSKQASALLVAAHCAVGKITTSSSTTVPKNQVISSRPAAGTSHPTGTKVNFVLSSGKPKKK